MNIIFTRLYPPEIKGSENVIIFSDPLIFYFLTTTAFL